MAKKAFVYDGTNWIDIAQSTADLSNYANMTTTPISGFRNAIINGDFRINQRNFTSITADGTFGFDRWRIGASGGTTTHSSVAFTPGNAIPGYEPTNHARLVSSGQSTADSYSILLQPIEGVRTFAGQTITISFWAKTASGTPKVAVELDQQFGTGGSSRVTTYVNQFTLSTSWTRYSVTTTVPSISGKTIGTDNYLGLFLWTSAGSNFNARTGSLGIQSTTIDFWGVQVELGTKATPFEQRFIGTELSLCHRYYWRRTAAGAASAGAVFGSGACSATTQSFIEFYFPTEMRVVPTLSISSGNLVLTDSVNYNLGSVTIASQIYNSTTTARITFSHAGTGTVHRPHVLAASVATSAAWVDATAEL